MKTLSLLLLLPIIVLAETVVAIDEQPSSATTTMLSKNPQIVWVDERVAAIQPPRTGLSSVLLDSVKNPFTYQPAPVAGITTKEGATKSAAKPVAERRPLKLYAIMNDQALINGIWFKVNDKVRDYRVSRITDNMVVLKSGKTTKQLFVTQPNSLILIQAQ